MSRAEAIAHQRMQLKKKLGFGGAGSMDLGMDSLLDDEDLVAVKQEDNKSKVMMSQLSAEV